MTLMTNALAAKYVQMHGMQSTKWTTKDKITQYKGLVNLYKRDREITQIDAAIAAKRQNKELKNLRKTIDINRQELNDAEAGDRQQLRNTLSDHRRLQMAYHSSPPKKVIDGLEQINFTKRKVLDKLKYQMKQRSQRLIDLRLEEAILQDRLQYEQLYAKLDGQKEAQNITGKVQNALLKKEAALAIQQSYGQIIELMKKDALYFHGILTTVQNDYWYQCRCVLNATKQGQLATEYKHDREQEYECLEHAVISDMKTQRDDLNKVRNNAEKLHSNLKNLLRRDSDLTTCELAVEESEDFLTLHKDLEKIESALTFLKSKTLVTSFEMIYPSLYEQVRQKKRLTALAKKCERNKDILMNKLNHAELMSVTLDTTMVETTGEYKKRKKELVEKINDETAQLRELDSSRHYKQKLIAQIRIALRQIQQLCRPIRMPNEKVVPPKPHNIWGDEIEAPEPIETDALKIIEILTPRLTFLMSNRYKGLDAAQLNTAFKYYEVLMEDSRIGPDPELKVAASLLGGVTTEAGHLLTREDIKKQSARIVAAAAKEDEAAGGDGEAKKK